MKKYIAISGKVQGVGFRYWLYMKAIEKNIFGVMWHCEREDPFKIEDKDLVRRLFC